MECVAQSVRAVQTGGTTPLADAHQRGTCSKLTLSDAHAVRDGKPPPRDDLLIHIRNIAPPGYERSRITVTLLHFRSAA